MRPCGREACEEHGDLCAYHGDEKGRCPTCHATWRSILWGGYHSCEEPKRWPVKTRTKQLALAKARRAHAERAQVSDSDPFCPHTDPSSLNPICSPSHQQGETDG